MIFILPAYNITTMAPAKVNANQSNVGFLGFPYDGDDGWGWLHESLADTDIRCPVLPPNARLDAERYVQAMKAVIPDIRTAVNELLSACKPRIVSEADFSVALAQTARHVLGVAHESPDAVLAFAVSACIKSNLWIFLRIMRVLQLMQPNERAWKKLRERLWLVLDAHSTQRVLPSGRDVILIAVDDCAYSGLQLRSLIIDMERAIKPALTVVCPVYCTQHAISALRERISSPMSVSVSRLIGYPAIHMDIFNSDIAMCCRGPGSGPRWVVETLFETLRVVEYGMNDASVSYGLSDNAKVCFEGANVRLSVDLSGHDAVAFYHKVADPVSIPTSWFLLGPTLRHALLHFDTLRNAVGKVEVAVTPLKRLMQKIDKKGCKRNQAQQPSGCSPTNRWHIGYKELFVGDDLIPSDAFRTVVTLEELPVFVPLLKPPEVCGAAFSKARDMASTVEQPWIASDIADHLWTKPADGLVVNECVIVPYKAVLKNALSKSQNSKLSSAIMEGR